MAKKDAKTRLTRWILLSQEFYYEVNDWKKCENQVAYHFYQLETNMVDPNKRDIVA